MNFRRTGRTSVGVATNGFGGASNRSPRTPEVLANEALFIGIFEHALLGKSTRKPWTSLMTKTILIRLFGYSLQILSGLERR
ncbi:MULTISPECIES: hypothetical protein [Gracilibacillus]|uniref:hypothetical protein n=1 Tax=Gracilibacillus TaxID=74385 RepID=UPI00102FD007|nr:MULTISPECIES: hypothetical protein [Gracilibacillus]